MKRPILTILAIVFLAYFSQAQTSNDLYCKYDFNGNAFRTYQGGTTVSQDFNNATATTDRFGNAASAYHFVAASNKIITYPASNFTAITSNNFSISCWVKLAPSNNAQRAIISHYYSTNCGNTRSFALLIQADNSVSFNVYEPGSNPSYASISFGSITDTAWHHIVVGYDMITPTNLSFISYIDGVAISSTRIDNIVGTWTGADGTVARAGIGSLPQIGVGACATNSPFDGRIDDIYFYSKLLTPTEVLTNYNAPDYTSLPKIKYVDKNATNGSNFGDSWANAYLNLQDALSTNTVAGDTIFVMEGNYTTNVGFDVVTQNLKVFGGFHATGLTLATRDWANHKTVLDGDFSNNDVYPMTAGTLGFLGDNAANVLIISANQAEIDGFQIRGGNGTAIYSKDHGANSTNITLRNCEVTESSGDGLADKVGLYVSESNSLSHTFTVENCHFHDLYGRYFVPFYFYLVNNTDMDVIFVNNLVNDNKTVDLASAGHRAGAGGDFTAMDGSTLNAKIINSTFANNFVQGTNTTTNLSVISANEELGAAATLNIECYNSIFWGNTATRSFDQFATTYEKMTGLIMHNNITADVPNNTYSNNNFMMTNASQTDPLFENAATKNYALSNVSTAINGGSTATISIYIPMYDVLMMPRVYGTAIDLGAIENQLITSISHIQSVESIEVYPNPASDVLTINTTELISSVRIFSVTGVLVKEIQHPTNNNILIADLASGLYVLELMQNDKIGVAQFVKK